MRVLVMPAVALLLVPAGLLLAPASRAQAIDLELLRNGDFEAGDQPTGWRAEAWVGDAAAAVDADAHGGERALRMTAASEGATAVASQSMALLSATAPLTLRGWWRGEVAQGTGARIVLRWTDAGGERLRDEAPLSAADRFDWQRFEMTFDPPEGAARATLFLEIWESLGSVWYDDLSVTQSIAPPTPGEFETGRTPEVVTVGVFDANAAGGRGFGAQGVLDALADLDGVSAEMIADVSLATLGRFDVVVLPNVHTWGAGAVSDLLAEHPELAWMASPRASVAAWVRMGGGLILTHQSNGSSAALSPTVVPQVTDVLDKTADTRPTTFAEHPVTAGIALDVPHPQGYYDQIQLRPGLDGTALARSAGDGNAVVIAGEFGAGRYVAIGLAVGLNADTEDAEPAGAEAQLLLNAVTWAAG